MKHFFKSFGIQLGAFVSVIATLGVVYAAWNDTVSTGDPVSSSSWNTLVSKVSDMDSVLSFSGGNLGIGISNPQQEIHIRDAGGDAIISVDAAVQSRLNLFSDAIGTGKQWHITNEANSGRLRISVADDRSDTNFQTNMTITDGGNVGIGTSTPSARLEVTSILHDKITIKTGSNTPGDRSYIKFINNSDVLMGYIASGVDGSIAMYNGAGQGIHINSFGGTNIWSLAGSYSGGSAYVCVDDSGTIYASETACP